jgi:peptide/nickel transport system ATP-binding protein
MYAGQVVETADTIALFDDLRHPYAEALLHSIPRLKSASHTRLDAISGRPPDMVRPPAGCRFAPRCRYAQASCLDDNPTLEADSGAETDERHHWYRCRFPVGTPLGERAWLQNHAAGRTAAGLDLGAVVTS